MKNWKELPLKVKFRVAAMRVGKFLGCHQIPERSFTIGGYQFPLCARCTGICAGYPVGGLLLIWFRIPILVCVCMCAVMFFDWFIQYTGLKQSTNLRRFLTGLICGTGYLQFIAQIILLLIKLIK